MSNSVDNTDDTIKDEARIEAESEKAFEVKEVTLRRRITRPESDTEGEGKSCERERTKQETKGNSRNEKRPTTDAGQPEHGSPSNNTKREEEEAVQDLPGKVALDVIEKEKPTLAARPIPGHDPTQTDAPSHPRAASYKVLASVAIVIAFVVIGLQVYIDDMRGIERRFESVRDHFLSVFGNQNNAIRSIKKQLSTQSGETKALNEQLSIQSEEIRALKKQLSTGLIQQESKIKELERELRPLKLDDCKKVTPKDAKIWNKTGGVFDIYIRGALKEVYCDLETDGGGWLVFQRRMDGSEEFRRNWSEYANGFGRIQKEFWLGLRVIHAITSSGKYELRIDLKDWEGNDRYASYSQFQVLSEETAFELSVSGYTGNAGDSFSGHTGMRFSTKDRDFDKYDGECAKAYKGAWWYNNCHSSNLNGFYFYGGNHRSYADGIEWYQWKGHKYSMKFTEMKLRRL